jgi:hypothetical protein
MQSTDLALQFLYLLFQLRDFLVSTSPAEQLTLWPLTIFFEGHCCAADFAVLSALAFVSVL